MGKLKLIFISGVLTGGLYSCRIYSSGHTQLAPSEKFEVYSLNSTARVKLENFSTKNLFIVKNSNKIILPPEGKKNMKLVKGDTIELFHVNKEPVQCQLRCIMFFGNRVDIKRTEIDN